MFRSPATGFKLKRASAKGGNFYYCADSGGRLLTLVMAKHFFGADGAREVWVRAEVAKQSSENSCPSCDQSMRLVSEPRWMGGGEIDVCRRCHLFWIDGDKHAEVVPLPDDLLAPEGDSTLVAEVGRMTAELHLRKAETEAENASLVGDGPDGILKSIPGFMGLPVEMTDHSPTHVWATGFVAVAIIFIQFLFTSRDPEILWEFGFYPGEPFKNFGLNALVSPFLHGGWLHVLGNFYFFAVFADDVEEKLGFRRFVLLFLFSAAAVAFGAAVLSSSPAVPHVGLSGVIMAVIAFYALEFPKSRVAYLVPISLSRQLYLHALFGGVGSRRTSGLNPRWLRLPAWVVALGFIAKDLVLYFAHEKNLVSKVSYSSHLAGAVAGLLLWFVLRQRVGENISGAAEPVREADDTITRLESPDDDQR